MTTEPSEIVAVTGHRRWDSRGRPTVEVVVRTAVADGRALAPAGASTGAGEALDLRDGGSRLGGWDVMRAVANVANRVAPAVVGLDAADQAGVDAAIDALDESGTFATLGGNVAVATSMATAHAAAASQDLPLWRALDAEATLMPLPEIQVFGGGAHADRRIDLQDLMVVPLGAGSFAEALEWASEVYLAAGRWLDARGRRSGTADEGGWWPAFDANVEAFDALEAAIEDAGFRPGHDVAMSVDVAASQFGGAGEYRLGRDGAVYDRDQWTDVLLGWLDRYPIASIEDPFAEDDAEGMVALMAAVGDRVQIVGDDYLVTDARRVCDAAAAKAANAVLVKPNQAGTLSRARAALLAAREAGMGTIVSARSGETEDVTVVHLAVGWQAGAIKVGSVTRGERTAKWNELLRIEEQLGSAARFAGRAGLGPSLSKI